MRRSWPETLSARLAEVPGLFLQRSRFADKPAYYLAGREVLHFHGESAVDIRLGRKEIRARREKLAARATFRKSSSADWVEVGLASSSDVKLIVDLVEALSERPG